MSGKDKNILIRDHYFRESQIKISQPTIIYFRKLNNFEKDGANVAAEST